MPVILTRPSESADSPLVSRFKFNEIPTTVSGTTVYSLAYSPVEDTTQVYVNGLLKEPGMGKDYTILGKIITFSGSLGLNDVILTSYIVQ
jgi:hypothetical protein